MLEVLAGDPSLADMPEEGCLLYCYSDQVEFAGQVPPFAEWGLRPAGLEGPRESPVFVVPLLAASAELAPEVGAGGRLLSNDGGAAAEEPASLGAPEVSSPGAQEIHPEEAPGRTAQSDNPEGEAPEAPTSHHGAETDDYMLPSTHEVASSGATPAALVIGDHTRGFGRFHSNFEALRKRKGSPSCSGDAF